MLLPALCSWMGLYHAALGGDKGRRGRWRELSGVRVGWGRHAAPRGCHGLSRGRFWGSVKTSYDICRKSHLRVLHFGIIISVGFSWSFKIYC